MRKAAIALACIIALCTAGTGNLLNNDISKKSVVQGVGLDINPDGTYSVTLEIINTENYSNSDTTAKPVMNVRTFTGETVTEAIKSAHSIDGKTLTLSQNRVIIIGKKLAEKGIMPALDYFLRDAENYSSTLIGMADSDAKELFSSATSESKVVSRDIEKMMLTSKDDLTVTSIELYELVNRYKSAGSCFYMPILTVEKNGDKSETASKGTAVFRDGKFVTGISSEETESLNFLCDNVKTGIVSFNMDENHGALCIIKNKTAINVQMTGGLPEFNIKITLEADLAEFDYGIYEEITQSDIESFCKSSEEKNKRSIEALVNKLYKDDRVDAPGLSRLLYIKFPSFYRNEEKNLSEVMANSRYSVEVEVKIRRTGQESVT